MAKVAVVTGSTRGIGKATALALARRGYKVVVTGRTLDEGQGRVVMPFGGGEAAVPGSVQATLAAIRQEGGEAVGHALDIMDRGSIDRLMDFVLAECGRIDVLVNNAIYTGPGLMLGLRQFELAQLEACLTGTVINQAHITRRALEPMIAAGGGAVVFLGSVAGLGPPARGPAEGGWGLLHGASKSAFHRIAEFLHLEHARDGIRSFLVEPQLTITESMKVMFGDRAGSIGGVPGYPPEATGDVIGWLVAEDLAGRHAGRILSAPTFFRDNNIAA
jgi:NAD(P)-dependent dehydrogenase (short-subunit alcohol dehydrogenase family)